MLLNVLGDALRQQTLCTEVLRSRCVLADVEHTGYFLVAASLNGEEVEDCAVAVGQGGNEGVEHVGGHVGADGCRRRVVNAVLDGGALRGRKVVEGDDEGRLATAKDADALVDDNPAHPCRKATLAAVGEAPDGGEDGDVGVVQRVGHVGLVRQEPSGNRRKAPHALSVEACSCVAVGLLQEVDELAFVGFYVLMSFDGFWVRLVGVSIRKTRRRAKSCAGNLFFF